MADAVLRDLQARHAKDGERLSSAVRLFRFLYVAFKAIPS
jgi:hypothetical protein